MRQFVFGYGSLARDYSGEGFVATLPGFVRRWGVAMDNRVDLPGYKYYTALDGSRPAVFVCFLDVVDGAGSVVGRCVPADDARLATLDVRERNYTRVDVSNRFPDLGRARVWVYAGSGAARARAQAGRRDGTAVVDGAYLAAVRDGFRALGDEVFEACRGSLQPGDLPVLELTRHDLP